MGKAYSTLTEAQLAALVASKDLMEICHADET